MSDMVIDDMEARIAELEQELQRVRTMNNILKIENEELKLTIGNLSTYRSSKPSQCNCPTCIDLKTEFHWNKSHDGHLGAVAELDSGLTHTGLLVSGPSRYGYAARVAT